MTENSSGVTNKLKQRSDENSNCVGEPPALPHSDDEAVCSCDTIRNNKEDVDAQIWLVAVP